MDSKVKGFLVALGVVAAILSGIVLGTFLAPPKAGLQGPQGLVGASGPVGPLGRSGNSGPRGLQGLQGVQGMQGISGLPGPAGPQGDPGVPGPGGVQGLYGAAGSQGPIGPQGEMGSQGPAGPLGPDGPRGPVGSPLPMPIAKIATEKMAYYRGDSLWIYGSGFLSPIDLYLVGERAELVLLAEDQGFSGGGAFRISVQIPANADRGPSTILAKKGPIDITATPIRVR